VIAMCVLLYCMCVQSTTCMNVVITQIGPALSEGELMRLSLSVRCVLCCALDV
jgi:hypothetical protein